MKSVIIILEVIVVMGVIYIPDWDGSESVRNTLKTELTQFQAKAWQDAAHEAVKTWIRQGQIDPYYQGWFQKDLEDTKKFSTWGGVPRWVNFQVTFRNVTEFIRIRVKDAPTGDPLQKVVEKANKVSHLLYKLSLLINEVDKEIEKTDDLRLKFDELKVDFRVIVPEKN